MRTRTTITNGGVGNLAKRYSSPTTRKNATTNDDNPGKGWKLHEEGVTPSLGWGPNTTIPAPTTVGKAREGNQAELGGSAPFFSFLFGFSLFLFFLNYLPCTYIRKMHFVLGMPWDVLGCPKVR